MNLIKILVLPFFTLFLIAQAEAPIVLTPLPERETPIVANYLVAPQITPLEAVLSQYEWDIPTMTAVFHCESGLQQFRADGTPVMSHTRDFGVAQINEKVWDSTAIRLGLDYKYSLEDNIKMAWHVYKVQNLQAWVCYNNGNYQKYLIK
jgi:hypothetical protein